MAKPPRGVNIRCPYCKAKAGKPCHGKNDPYKLPLYPMHKARETAFMAWAGKRLRK